MTNLNSRHLALKISYGAVRWRWSVKIVVNLKIFGFGLKITRDWREESMERKQLSSYITGSSGYSSAAVAVSNAFLIETNGN